MKFHVTSHQKSGGVNWSDIVTPLIAPPVGLAIIATADKPEHKVEGQDGFGNRAVGYGDTYAQAVADAKDKIERRR